VLAVFGEPRRIGHKRPGPSFETPRKRAAPQDDDRNVAREKEFMNISRAGSKNDALPIGSTKIDIRALP
jgi:hypothetical protein